MSAPISSGAAKDRSRQATYGKKSRTTLASLLHSDIDNSLHVDQGFEASKHIGTPTYGRIRKPWSEHSSARSSIRKEEPPEHAISSASDSIWDPSFESTRSDISTDTSDGAKRRKIRHNEERRRQEPPSRIRNSQGLSAATPTDALDRYAKGAVMPSEYEDSTALTTENKNHRCDNVGPNLLSADASDPDHMESLHQAEDRVVLPKSHSKRLEAAQDNRSEFRASSQKQAVWTSDPAQRPKKGHVPPKADIPRHDSKVNTKTKLSPYSANQPSTPPRKVPVHLELTPGSLALPDLQISGPRSDQDTFPHTATPIARPRTSKLKDKLLSSQADAHESDSEGFGDAIERPTPALDLIDKPLNSTSNFTKSIQLRGDAPNSGGIPSTGPKHTYLSSRPRTYLTELDIDNENPANVIPSRYAETSAIRAQIKGSKDTEFDFGDSEMPGPLRSIHELRKAGNNARSVGEVDTLLDDITDATNKRSSMKRRSMLALSEKLFSPAICHRFLEQGFESRLLNCIGTDSDPIFNTLLLAALLLLVANPGPNHSWMRDSGLNLVDFACGGLERSESMADIAAEPQSNVTKMFQTELKNFDIRYTKSPIWRCEKPAKLSMRSVSLQCLEYIIRTARESGFTGDLLSPLAISQLTAIFGFDTADGTASNTDVSLALSILESLSVVSGHSEKNSQQNWLPELARVLATKLPALYQSFNREAPQNWSLTLRLLLNLSNDEAVGPTCFAGLPFVWTVTQAIRAHFKEMAHQAFQDSEDTILDNCVLSLGLLINVVEKAPESREVFLKRIENTQPIYVLLELFKSRLHRAFEVVSEEETKINVAFGYLSLLLGYLCLNRDIEKHMKTQLGEGSLGLLVVAVEEFLNYYQKVADDIQDKEGSVNLKTIFLNRLQGVVDELRLADH